MSCFTARCKIEKQCARYVGNIFPQLKVRIVGSLAPADGRIVTKPEDCDNFKKIEKK